MFPCVKRALSKFLIRDYSFVSLFLLLQICSVMDCARKKSNTTLLERLVQKGMSNKKPLSEAQKKANAKYLSKFAEMRIRLEPDYYEEIKLHAESMGESGAAFAKRAIAETMERDRQTKNTDKN